MGYTTIWPLYPLGKMMRNIGVATLFSDRPISGKIVMARKKLGQEFGAAF
jgi:hypothetical protein